MAELGGQSGGLPAFSRVRLVPSAGTRPRLERFRPDEEDESVELDDDGVWAMAASGPNSSSPIRVHSAWVLALGCDSLCFAAAATR